MEKIVKDSLAALASVCFFVIIWTAMSLSVASEFIAPSPIVVAKEFVSIFSGEKLSATIGAIVGTFERTVQGYFSALLAALLAAVVADRFSLFEKAFYPIVAIARAMPTMSIILLVLIWLKPTKSPILISFLVIFPMLYSAVLGALKNRDRSIGEMAKSYGVNKAKLFFEATLPNVAEALFPQISSTLAFAVKLTVSGEALANSSLSLGREMYVAQVNLETARLLAYTLVAVLLSIAVELVLKFFGFATKKVVYGYNRRKTEQALLG